MNSWKENIDKFHFADVRNFNAFDLTDKYLSSGRANMESELVVADTRTWIFAHSSCW